MSEKSQPQPLAKSKPDQPFTAQVLDLILAGYWEWGIQENSQYLSPEFKRMFGYEDHELPNAPETWQRLIFPEDLPRVFECLDLHVKSNGKVPHNLEVRYHHRDGSTVWVICSGKVIEWSEEGTPLRMVGCHMNITHLKEKEAALRESEERWSHALEGSGDAMWDWDFSTNKVFFSPRWKAMLGYQDHEIGDSLDEWENRVHPDDLAEAKVAIRRHLNGESPVYVSEHRVRCKDGQYKWLLDRGKIVKHASNGEPLRLIGTHSDITEKRMMEQRLRESEERLRATFDAATGVSVIRADSQGTITFFSRGAEELIGYKSEEMVGLETPAIFHDEDEIAARSRELSEELGEPIEGFRVFVTMAELHGSERREWTYICKDGSRKSIDLTVTVSRDTAGVAVSYLGTAVDITERKEMENALRASEQQLKAAVDSQQAAHRLLEAAGRIARVGHWELELSGNGPYWSDVTCDIHGVPPGTQVSFEEAVEFYLEEDRGWVAGAVAHTVATGEPFEFEAQLQTPDGTRRWIHSRGEPVRDENGEIRVLRGVFQDIDDNHRAAEMLEQSNRELIIATQRAEEHARAKAEFLANMSHEIRTPLNAVIGMADVLRSFQLGERERELVETIHNSGDMLLGLINDILDFSKIESGQLELEEIPLQVRECVESALDVVAELAAKKQLELLYWIDPTLPLSIHGDVTRLRQILVNLTSNALKFTHEGEVFVKLTCRTDENGKQWLHVAVRDSGIGIPAERMDKLFHAFSQVDASTTRRYGGTGLGLVISHRLIHRMNGRIWLESAVQKGSTFQFEIPIRPAPISQSGDDGKSADPSLKGLRVLMVSCNATQQWVLRHQMEMWGMIPMTVDDMTQALDLLRCGEKVDLAVLDVLSPEMDGNGLLSTLRTICPGNPLPALQLTRVNRQPSSLLPELERCLILTKPWKVAQLFKALREVLDLPREEKSLETQQMPPAKLAGETCPLHVLLAEDNPVNQRVANLMLQRLGYHPVTVANGLEVLEALELTRFDVVLLDVQMPEMDGLEAARQIHLRYPSDVRPWLIALTANAMAGDRDICLKAGMDDYLSKPVRSDALETVLRKAFAARLE